MSSMYGVRRPAIGRVRLAVAGLAFAVAMSPPTSAQGPFQASVPPPDARDPVAGFGPVTSFDLVRRALDGNAGLAAARLDVARARTRLRQAGARPNPTVDVGRRTGRFTGSTGDGETSVGVSLPLELFGQRSRRIDVAEAELAAADAEIADCERRLASEVRARCAEALAARRELEIIEGLGRLDAETARVVAVRVNEGESAPLEYRLLQVEIARLDSRRAVVEGRFRAALVELRALAGLSADEPIPLGEDLARTAWSGTSPPLDEAIAAALDTRPDLRLARLEERIAEAGLQIHRAESAPEVTAFGRYTVERTVVDDTPVGPIGDRDRTLSFGISIGLPVFNRNQGARVEAEVAIAQARKRREYAEQRVRTEVGAALTRLRAAEAAVTAYEHGVVTRSNDNLRSIRGAYQVGAYRITELLSEQRRFFDAEREYTETLAERYRALADLQTAIGIAAPFGERLPAARPGLTGATPDEPPEPPPSPRDRANASCPDHPIAIDGGADTDVNPPDRSKSSPARKGPTS